MIFKMHKKLKTALNEISNDLSNSGEIKVHARVFDPWLFNYRTFCITFGAVCGTIVIMQKLSRELQAIDNSAEYALYGIEKTANRFKEMKTSEELARIFQKIECLEDLERHGENQHRKRKMPGRHSDYVVHAECTVRALSNVSQSDQKKRAYCLYLEKVYPLCPDILPASLVSPNKILAENFKIPKFDLCSNEFVNKNTG